jgi:hypothetical protein
MKDLVDLHFPHAEKITVVVGNLNTHRAASLYAAFTPQEARRLLDRFEFHYTPKHGSWLNMAEMEFSVLSRHCLDRRIPNRETLNQEVTAWESTRNAKSAKADWRFTVDDARIKLKKLNPVIPNCRSTGKNSCFVDSFEKNTWWRRPVEAFVRSLCLFGRLSFAMDVVTNRRIKFFQFLHRLFPTFMIPDFR